MFAAIRISISLLPNCIRRLKVVLTHLATIRRVTPSEARCSHSLRPDMGIGQAKQSKEVHSMVIPHPQADSFTDGRIAAVDFTM
jgi:hypothetical protein